MTWHDLGPRREGRLQGKGDPPRFTRFLSFLAIFLFASHPSLRCPLSNKEQIISLLFAPCYRFSLSLSLSTSFHLAPYFLEAVQGLFIVSRVLPLLLFFHSTAARFLLPFEGERDEKLIFQTAERERRTRPPLRRFINALAFEVGGGGGGGVI